MTRTVHKIRPFSRIYLVQHVFFLIIPVVIARKSSALLIKNQMTSYFLSFLFFMTMTVHKRRDCISSARFFSSEICSAHVFFSNFCSFICSICMVLLLLKVMRLWHLVARLRKNPALQYKDFCVWSLSFDFVYGAPGCFQA